MFAVHVIMHQKQPSWALVIWKHPQILKMAIQFLPPENCKNPRFLQNLWPWSLPVTSPMHFLNNSQNRLQPVSLQDSACTHHHKRSHISTHRDLVLFSDTDYCSRMCRPARKCRFCTSGWNSGCNFCTGRFRHWRSGPSIGKVCMRMNPEKFYVWNRRDDICRKFFLACDKELKKFPKNVENRQIRPRS